MRESDKEQLFVVLLSFVPLPEEPYQVLISGREHVPPANFEPGNEASSHSSFIHSDSPKGNLHGRPRQQCDFGV